MGDGEKTPLKLNFDSKVRLEFRGVTITSADISQMEFSASMIATRHGNTDYMAVL